MNAPHARILISTLPADGVPPEAFLHRARGEARGFWARGERWVAHRGVSAVLVGSDGNADRYAAVRAAAASVVGGGVTSRGDEDSRDRRVRFYGGFSFRSDHQAKGFWSAFPGSLFHLPAVELVGDASGGARLHARAVVTGDTDAEAVLAAMTARLEGLRSELQGWTGAPPAPTHARKSETERASWESAVEESLEAIRGGTVSKVVLARTLDVHVTDPVDPVEVVLHLWEVNRGTHVFLFEPEPGTALVGAAPETVATLRKGVFRATAVAGSIRRGESPEEQRDLARRLLASAKDRAEQRIALDDMVRRLRTVASEIRVESEPHVLTLNRIQHLETEIRARVPEGRDVLDLLRLLHPTPATCGLPRDEAMDFLALEEPFERGWYAGPVGWFDTDGNGMFAPALRTAVTVGREWRLFAGAGIVEGSVPALEWEETRIKFEPVLRALDASGVIVADGAEVPAHAEKGA